MLQGLFLIHFLFIVLFGNNIYEVLKLCDFMEERAWYDFLLEETCLLSFVDGFGFITSSFSCSEYEENIIVVSSEIFIVNGPSSSFSSQI